LHQQFEVPQYARTGFAILTDPAKYSRAIGCDALLGCK
jgi:hypothetical protein